MKLFVRIANHICEEKNKPAVQKYGTGFLINPYENQLLLFGYNCTNCFLMIILQLRCHKGLIFCALTILLEDINRFVNELQPVNQEAGYPVFHTYTDF